MNEYKKHWYPGEYELEKTDPHSNHLDATNNLNIMDVYGFKNNYGCAEISKKDIEIADKIINKFRDDYISTFSQKDIKYGKKACDEAFKELDKAANDPHLWNRANQYSNFMKKDKQYKSDLSDYKKGLITAKYDEVYDKLNSILNLTPSTGQFSDHNRYENKEYRKRLEEYDKLVNNDKTDFTDIEKFVNKYYKY